LNDYLAKKIGFLIKKESAQDKIRQDVTSGNVIYINLQACQTVLGQGFI